MSNSSPPPLQACRPVPGRSIPTQVQRIVRASTTAMCTTQAQTTHRAAKCSTAIFSDRNFHFYGVNTTSSGSGDRVHHPKQLSDAEVRALNNRLIEAAAHGHLRTVKYLIGEGAQPSHNQANHEGLTAQHYACAADYHEIASLLFEYYANVDASSNRYGTPLCLAVFMRSRKAVELLLEHGALVWRHGGIFGSAIHAACFKNDPQLLALLLENDKRHESRAVDIRALEELQRPNLKNLYDFINEPDQNTVDVKADTKTHHLSLCEGAIDFFKVEPVEALEALRDHIANASQQPLVFVTALAMLSSEKYYEDQEDVVKLLIDQDSRIDGPTFTSVLPDACMIAAMAGSAKIMHILLKTGVAVTQEQRNRALGGLVVVSGINQRPGHRVCLQSLMSTGVWGDDELDHGVKLDAFMIAAGGKAGDILRTFVDDGVQLDYQDKRGTTALSIAACKGRKDNVQILLNAGARLEIRNNNGSTALTFAANDGHADVTRVLLDAGAEVDPGGHHGWTPLLHTACDGYKDAARELLNAGAQVDHVDDSGVTSLMLASFNGHTELVQVLLDASARINQSNKHGSTSLTLASSSGHTDIVRLLLDAGAQVDHRDNGGYTPLIWAAREGRTDTVLALLGADAKVDSKTESDYTALLKAAANGHAEVVQVLLDAGADPSHSAGYGITARYLALSNGHENVDQLLRRRGARFSLSGKAESLVRKLKSGI